VPIPGSGMQLTNIAHARDLSSMLTLAVENPEAASGRIFNCVSDRAVTLDGMAKLCAQAAGLPVEIVHYDPKVVGIDAKKAFPFRNMVMAYFHLIMNYALNYFSSLFVHLESSLTILLDSFNDFISSCIPYPLYVLHGETITVIRL